MTTFAIRTDASYLIGSGHIIRCRTLARRLRESGASVLFVCRQQEGDLIGLIKNEFEVLILPSIANELQPDDKNNDMSSDIYEKWLGCSQLHDANDTLDALLNHSSLIFDWLIVDHYGLSELWEKKVLDGLSYQYKQQIKCFVIDDLANRRHLADVLLDQNFSGKSNESRYKYLVPEACNVFLGPHNALLSNEYSYLHRFVPLRSEVKRILVFFGGVDPQDCTSKVLKILMLPEFVNLTVDVVVGRQNYYINNIKKLVLKRQNTFLYSGLASLATLIGNADLAIGAGGSTTWERSCLALPSLIFSIAANQVNIMRQLHKNGNLIYVGCAESITISSLTRNLSLMMNNIKHFSFRSRLTDGYGAYRISTVLLQTVTQLYLRKVNIDDELLLFSWANNPLVRNNSFSPQEISYDDHHSWFLKGLTNLHRLQYIAIDVNQCPIGQIRFDRNDNLVTIDISLDQSVHGLGLCKELVQQGLSCLFNEWGHDLVVVAEVLLANKASQLCFFRSGFYIDEKYSSELSIRLIYSPNY